MGDPFGGPPRPVRRRPRYAAAKAPKPGTISWQLQQRFQEQILGGSLNPAEPLPETKSTSKPGRPRHLF